MKTKLTTHIHTAIEASRTSNLEQRIKSPSHNPKLRTGLVYVFQGYVNYVLIEQNMLLIVVAKHHNHALTERKKNVDFKQRKQSRRDDIIHFKITGSIVWHTGQYNSRFHM